MRYKYYAVYYAGRILSWGFALDTKDAGRKIAGILQDFAASWRESVPNWRMRRELLKVNVMDSNVY